MSSDSSRDSLYAKPFDQINQFVFDENVARVFEDMLSRSVPGYRDIVAMIGVLAKRYAKDGSKCYDLGASLGAVTLAMASQINAPGCEIIAVDNSEAMVEKCKENAKKIQTACPIQVLCDDIQNVAIEKASMVVLNFTLQFIEPGKRLALLQKIYQGLNPGGVLILSEKVDFADANEHDFQIDLHHTFKKMHGYSDLEISQKRTALENILIPETIDAHQKRLGEAGFSRSTVWFQCFNFVSFIAFK